MNNRNIKEKVLPIFSCLFLFLCFTIALSPLIGTCWSFAGLKWGCLPVILILVFSVFIVYQLRKIDFFKIESWWELIILGGMTLFVLFIYIQYSPVLSIQQDQALYIMKTFDLLNYGTLEKPVDTFVQMTQNGIINPDSTLFGYGAFANGTQVRGSSLYPDFYSGSAFFYAICGIIGKKYVFYGQTLVMVANCGLLYFLLKNIMVSRDKLVSAIYTMAFAVAPVIIWFGRSSSTEPTALFFWLLIFSLLLIKDVPDYILALVFMTAMTSRIDYFLVVLLGIFIITYRNRKWGGIYTAATIGFAYIVSHVYWIYYNRIAFRDFKIIKYQIPIYIIVFIISFLISKYGRKLVETIYGHPCCKYILIAIGFIVTFMMFRNTLTPEKYYGRFTEFGLNEYSYEEFILDHLYQTFPAIIIVVGLVGCYKLLKHEKMNMLAGIFMLPLLVISCYFVYKSGNAPQMYFLLRRYYNIFLPSLLVAFVVFMEFKSREKRVLLSAVLFLLSCNLYMDSKQKVQFAELDNAVAEFEKEYPAGQVGTIFFDYNDKFDISPIVSYGAYDMVSIQNENEMNRVCDHTQYYDKDSSIFLTTAELEGVQYTDIVDLSYYEMNETLLGIPRDYNFHEVKIYLYDMNDLVGNTYQFAVREEGQ
ncbi:hypothetical protein GCM10008922_34410 [Faecalicatena contorta]|uniref:hypothetical protein n=1 Tax=Faecalicatena contorta TaxID=39482 RepID=UPI0031DEE875